MVKVKIVGSYAEYDCTCGNWLEHWTTNSGQFVTWCCEKECTGTHLVGAHVKLFDKLGEADATYIIPLCKRHHNQDDFLEVDEIYKLVEITSGIHCNPKQLASNG